MPEPYYHGYLRSFEPYNFSASSRKSTSGSEGQAGLYELIITLYLHTIFPTDFKITIESKIYRSKPLGIFFLLNNKVMPTLLRFKGTAPDKRVPGLQ
jgi:hypothetical protein